MPAKRKPRERKPTLAHVVLSTGPNKGFGFCHHKQRWFVSYSDRGKLCREFNDCTNREEARAERDRRFMELAMAGARRKGEKVPLEKLPPRKERDLDYGIYEAPKKVIHYKVVLDRKYIGTYPTKAEARKVRDELMDERLLKPCALCGERPVMAIEGAHYRWYINHGGGESGCANTVRVSSRDGKQRMIKQWNEKLSKGKTK